MLLKRYLSIFVCVLTFILTFIYYEKPLHSEESENIDSLISAMWDRIGSQVEGISSSTKSSYEEKLQEKFKVRGIDETELGKKKIEELKKEFSDGLKSYFPKRDLQKYKNRILGIEADKREAEIEKIIKEEVDSAQTSFDNFLNTKNNEISAKVSETEKEIEDRLVENLVKEITDKQNEENKKLQQYVKDKLKIEKEYYNKQIKGYSKACKLPIQKNSNLNDQEKQNIFSKCNESVKGLQEIFKDLDKLGKDIIHSNLDLKIELRDNIENLKNQDLSITYKKIREKILKAVDDPSQQEGEEKTKKRSSQQDIDDSLKSMRERFDERLKSAEDESSKLLEKFKELLKQKKAENKMTEEEKKQKAEAEKLKKEIDAFLEKNKNLTIEDDSVLKNIIKCDYKKVVYNEGDNVEYCSKWIIGYSAEKIYKETSKNTKDLDFKLVCKKKDNLRLNFNDLPRYEGFIDKKVNNVSDSFFAKIEDVVNYSCPSGWYYVGSAKCHQYDSFTCDDWYCKADQPYEAPYKVWDYYLNRWGWKIWYRKKTCCITKYWKNVEGYECVGRGYDYIPSGSSVGGSVFLGVVSWGVSFWSDLLTRPNGSCVKTKIRDADRHTTHVYHVDHCIPSIRDNINLGKAYDPNFVMFQ